MLALDVTKPDQIKHAERSRSSVRTHRRARQQCRLRLFGWVEEEEEKNIRAIGYLAAVEEGEEKDIHAIFETNFLAWLR